jgi:hypothetical protein
MYDDDKKLFSIKSSVATYQYPPTDKYQTGFMICDGPDEEKKINMNITKEEIIEESANLTWVNKPNESKQGENNAAVGSATSRTIVIVMILFNTLFF